MTVSACVVIARSNRPQLLRLVSAMRLRFLGSDSEIGQCPSVYATDRDTYVVQGRAVTDREALADLRNVLLGETVVAKELVKHFPKAD